MACVRAWRLLPELASRSNPAGSHVLVSAVCWGGSRTAGVPPPQPAQAFAAGSVQPGMQRPLSKKETGRNSGNSCMRAWCSACPAGWRCLVLLWALPRCRPKKSTPWCARGSRAAGADGPRGFPGTQQLSGRAETPKRFRGGETPGSPQIRKGLKGAAAPSTWRAGARLLSASSAPAVPGALRGAAAGRSSLNPGPWCRSEPPGTREPPGARPWCGFFGHSRGVSVQ